VKKAKIPFVLALVAPLAGPLWAQSAPPAGDAAGPAATLKDVAQKAVLNNPEVQARWHAFKAATNEKDVARGGYFPRVDLVADTGREHLKLANAEERKFNRDGVALTLNQMLFDGFATSNEVKRLDEATRTRYFELLDASETAAQEAARAYLDVQRYRRLVAYAQENYAQHKLLFDQIQSKAIAGVGRRVDMEQAGGRLALAESNLITETSNLHDVTARYQRLLGELPPQQLASADLAKLPLPKARNEAVAVAMKQSPALQASIANLRAAQAEREAQRANFMPRLDLRARGDWRGNKDGVDGGYRDQVVELVLNYNLFKGGSDQARLRQFAERMDQAKDLRDKSCRDVRQTLAIAYNDTQRLVEQLRFLDEHQLSTEKVRDAYRKQFDIGQRTLLDLLDTENELFQSRRAYVNGQADLEIAHARAHAAMGDTLSSLGLKRLDAQVEDDPQADPAAGDISAICPADAPVPVETDKAAILAQALAASPNGRGTSPQPPGAPMGDAEALQRALTSWATAWSAKDAQTYLGFYAPQFQTGKVSREKWTAQRKARLAEPGTVAVTVKDVVVRKTGADSATTSFRLTYQAGGKAATSTKRLDWVRSGGAWLIKREVPRP
jgi:outer membrane protein, adhesin transport system